MSSLLRRSSKPLAHILACIQMLSLIVYIREACTATFACEHGPYVGVLALAVASSPEVSLIVALAGSPIVTSAIVKRCVFVCMK